MKIIVAQGLKVSNLKTAITGSSPGLFTCATYLPSPLSQPHFPLDDFYIMAKRA